MGALYDLCKHINDHLEISHAGDPIALVRAKGEVATRVGFLVSMVGPQDVDDLDKISRLKAVAAELSIPV